MAHVVVEEEEEAWVGEDDYDGTSSDEGGMMPPLALPVADVVGLDFVDFTVGLPDSAEEYLAMVRMEARKLPKVYMSKGNPSAAPSGSRAPADAALAAPVDVDASTKSGYGGYGARGQAQSSEGGAAGPSQAPPAVRKPLSAVLSREWVRSFVEDFGRLKSAAGGHDDPAGSAGGQLGIHTRRDAARLAQSIYGGQESETRLDMRPLLSYVGGMDRVATTRLIQELAACITSSPSTLPWPAGQWMFSLLCHVEEPLDPDTCAALYSLAVHCEDMLRSTAGTKTSDQAGVLLAVVGGYFRQSADVLELLRD